MRKCKGRYYAVAVGYKEFELGYFHCFSVQYEELGGGIGVYPVAIVELPDGGIVEPLADEIQFLHRPGERMPDLMKEEGVLVADEGRSDGLYVPEVTALRYNSLTKMNQKLTAAVDFIVADGSSQTTEGNWILSFDELKEKTGLCVEGEYLLQELLGDMLSERPEVADVVIENGCFDVDYYLNFCPDCQ